MRGRRFAHFALFVAAALATTTPLPAQAPDRSFLGASVGVAAKPYYGRSESQGLTAGLTVGRLVTGRAALRLDAELQRFGARDTSTCGSNPGGGCPPPPLGNGTIATVALLASGEWYVLPGRRGLYLLAGLGPQWLASHPDRPRSLRLAAQAGAGLAFPLGRAALLIEVRYQGALGARAEPVHTVPVTVTFRVP